MTDTPTKIRWSKVHKRFGSKVVLDGLDLDAKEGRSLVVIGGSGTGKSVLLKCALGLLAPEKGCVEIDGTNVKAGRHDDAGIAQIGMLFQSGALFDSLPVWENIAFRLIQHDKMKRAEARDRAISALKQVELDEDTGAKYPSELSGGMLKRAALARAIVSQPKILFFDEPTTGLHFSDVALLLAGHVGPPATLAEIGRGERTKLLQGPALLGGGAEEVTIEVDRDISGSDLEQ